MDSRSRTRRTRMLAGLADCASARVPNTRLRWQSVKEVVSDVPVRDPQPAHPNETAKQNASSRKAKSLLLKGEWGELLPPVGIFESIAIRRWQSYCKSTILSPLTRS